LPGTGATFNVAGRFEANNGVTNWGVWGIAPNTGSGMDLAGNFSGDVFVSGINCGTGYALTSDRQFKKNIQPLSNSLEILSKIQPKTYDYKVEEFPELRFKKQKQYGVIAQELEEVIPELVYNVKIPATLDAKGNIVKDAYDAKMVNYAGLIPVLIDGIKEQKAQVDAQAKQNEDLKKQLDNQQKQIDELKALITSCCSMGNTEGAKKAQGVTLSDKNVIVLNQNVPNPFAESTVISYSIPSDFSKAQILFSTADGKVIKVIDITEKGEGRLNVFANDLSNGMYSYSLVIDGKVHDTKKMIKQN
ncbi:MAG: Collagen triple helix repeat-containing protein, partial [Bacteroidetes bacterium]|nr:Collagen triple helix repeat-containing protein [Bacteroidota bacterium]